MKYSGLPRINYKDNRCTTSTLSERSFLLSFVKKKKKKKKEKEKRCDRNIHEVGTFEYIMLRKHGFVLQENIKDLKYVKIIPLVSVCNGKKSINYYY